MGYYLHASNALKMLSRIAPMLLGFYCPLSIANRRKTWFCACSCLVRVML